MSGTDHQPPTGFLNLPRPKPPLQPSALPPPVPHPAPKCVQSPHLCRGLQGTHRPCHRSGWGSYTVGACTAPVALYSCSHRITVISLTNREEERGMGSI